MEFRRVLFRSDAPIMIPEEYVPDLDLRMGLYRRMNELEARGAIESFAAELIDRFGKLPSATENLLRLIEIKMYCMKEGIAKIAVGPRGALVGCQERKRAMQGKRV